MPGWLLAEGPQTWPARQCRPRPPFRGRGAAGAPGLAEATRAGGRGLPSPPHPAPAPPAARTGPGSSDHPGSAGR